MAKTIKSIEEKNRGLVQETIQRSEILYKD